MAITLADLKFFGSERMTDNSDGGGRMSATEIVSGVENSVFDDVSDVDRAAGDVSIRKVYAAITSADTDKYLDASVAIFRAPADPSASVLALSTGSFYDERADVKNRIEQTISRGARWNGYLWGQHLIGQRVITLWQRTTNELPTVGGRLELIAYSSNVEQYSQYLWITKITSNTRTYYDDKGAFQINEVQCDLAEALAYNFTGIEPQRADTSNTNALVHATRYNADSVQLFGVMPLADAASSGQYNVKVDSLYAPIIPTAMSETALPDVNPGGDSPAIVITQGSNVGSPAMFSTATQCVKPDVSLFLGSAAKPGTVIVSVSGATLTDNNGVMMLSTTEVGTIDYSNGIVRWNSSVPNYSTATKTVSFTPACRPLRVADTAAMQVTAENRGFVWVMTLVPIPAPLTLRVSYRVNNVWYVIQDQGGGQLRGVDSSYGSGSLNFTTGTVTITTGALPDVESEIIFTWGTPINYIPRGGALVDPPMVRGQTAHTGITPGSVTVTWMHSLATWTVTDTASDGVLIGTYGVGAIDYATGEWWVAPTLLPALSTEFTIDYSYCDLANQISQTFTDPAREVNGHLLLTVGASGAIQPGTVVVEWNVIVSDYGEGLMSEALYGLYDQNKSARDNAAGALVIPGGTDGTVNYGSRIIDFLPDITASLAKPTEVTVQVGTDVNGNPVYRRVVTGFSTTAKQAAFPITGDVTVKYSLAGPDTSASETVTLSQLEIDLTKGYGENIVGGSIRFTLGTDTYVDTAGQLYRNPAPDTGAGTLSGTVDRVSGRLRINSWTSGGVNTVGLIGMVTELAGQPVDEVVFRTATAPIKVGTLQLRYVLVDGTAKSKTVDTSGVLEDADCKITVDAPIGVVRVRFGLWKQDSLLSPEEKLESWYNEDWRILRPDPLNPSGPLIYFIWKPAMVMADSIIYNAVAQTFLPPDSALLGIDAARLPPDGKGLIFRVGKLALVHNTDSISENSLSPTQVIDCGRVRLYRVVIEGANGVRLSPEQYTVNRELGTVTMSPTLSLTGLTSPYSIQHTVADMARIVETDINGTLTFNKAVSHTFPADTSYCSGLLYIGNMQARVTALFAQSTWTSVWQDTLIGSEPLAQYNDAQYPIIITNAGAYPDRILVKFTSSTAFQVIGEQLGIIGTGDITQDCSPLNSLTGVAYFTIDYRGWGVGWATGNCLRFNVVSASYPVDLIRAIQPSDPSGLDVDSVELLLLGNVDQ